MGTAVLDGSLAGAALAGLRGFGGLGGFSGCRGLGGGLGRLSRRGARGWLGRQVVERDAEFFHEGEDLAAGTLPGGGALFLELLCQVLELGDFGQNSFVRVLGHYGFGESEELIPGTDEAGFKPTKWPTYVQLASYGKTTR